VDRLGVKAEYGTQKVVQTPSAISELAISMIIEMQSLTGCMLDSQTCFLITERKRLKSPIHLLSPCRSAKFGQSPH